MLEFRRSFNCCKSFGCSNLGRVNSPDYTHDSYHLGFRALHCQRCGSYPPWVDDASVSQLLSQLLEQHFQPRLNTCPNCAPRLLMDHNPEFQHYGRTGAGNPRVRCKSCHKVYTLGRWAVNEHMPAILLALASATPPLQTMQQLEIAPKIYYQLLSRLAQGLRSWSREQEQQLKQRPVQRLLSESQIITFSGNRGLWTLASADADSGYILLHSHNASHQPMSVEGVYQSKPDSRLAQFDELSILQALRQRYEQTMQRSHFEELNLGELQSLRGGYLAKPALLAYAHFQALRVFSDSHQHIHHYLEQESCIRGAALMGCAERIHTKLAEVFYIIRHQQGEIAIPPEGHNVGWWNDRWYPDEFGAYCPITSRHHYTHPFKLAAASACEDFFSYVRQQVPTQLKSLAPLESLFEVARCLFNYCHGDNLGLSPAMRAGLVSERLTPEQLLHTAAAALAGEEAGSKKGD